MEQLKSNDWMAPPYSMFSASGEVAENLHRMYVGKSGKRWIVADRKNAGEYVYVEGGPNSDGFGGRTIKFDLTDGTSVSLKGPWHSNPEALFADTGVDVRDQFYTYCVIAKDRAYPNNRLVMVDVLYRDYDLVLGTFDRPDVDAMAKMFANELGHSVQVHKITHGGSSTAPVNPDGKGFIKAEG